MMSDLPCTNCGFEIGLLHMELPSSRQESRRARQDLVVHCPLCGQDHPGLLKTLGFFWRESEEKYRYWIEGSSTAGENNRKSNSVPIGTSGKLTLRFDKPAEPLGKTDILYAAVPLFEAGTGVQEPALPVREEYLDCLDEQALFEVRRDQSAPGLPKPPGWRFGQLQKVANRTTYVSLIPYRGVPREKWETVTRPLVASRFTRDDKPVFPGVFVRHWPHVDVESWRFHLVSFGVAQRTADTLLKDWTWRVKALVPPVLPTDRWTDHHVEDETAGMRVVTVPIDPTQGRVFTVSCDGVRRDGREDRNRPAWIAVQVDGPEGSGGGLFALPPARRVAPQRYTLTFGLDFGTSNTVLATEYEPDGKVRTVSPDPQRTTRQVVGEGAWDDPYDLWPGGTWLGPHRDLLPSELYSRVPWGELARDTARISRMILGVDLGIPLRLWSLGPSLAKGAAERLLVDFKWARAIAGRYDTIANQVWMVQSRFLEAAVLMAVVSRLCDGITWPEKIAINYSYPPAFSATDRKNLRDAVADAAQRVAAHLGLRDPSENQPAVQFEPGPDEAQAAVLGPLPNRMFTVFVDIGGGSLEVLVEDSLARPENKQGGHEGLQPEVVRNSLYFGGGTYLRALVNGTKTCIDGDYSTLSARVRGFPSGRDFVRAPGLFRTGRVDVARKRARVYGEAIADYVARMLAGMCLEHGFQYTREASPAEASRPLNLSRNRLFLWNKRTSHWELGEADATRPDERHVRFTLMLLGNGWNTVEIPIPESSGQTLESYFGGMVQQRLLEILEHERATAAKITDGKVTLNDIFFEVDCPPIVGTDKDQVLHRKAVVASNLVKTKRRVDGDGVELIRGILGLDLTVDGRRVEWYRPCGAPPVIAPDALKEWKGKAVPVSEASVSQGSLPSPSSPSPPVRPSNAGPPPRPSSGGPPPRVVWHLADASGDLGTFTGVAALIDRATQDRSLDEAARLDVWRDGFASWVALTSVPELATELAKRRPVSDPVVWYVAANDEQKGPLSVQDVLEFVSRFAPATTVEVWREGWSGWKALREVPEFQRARTPPGPPPRRGTERSQS